MPTTHFAVKGSGYVEPGVKGEVGDADVDDLDSSGWGMSWQLDGVDDSILDDEDGEVDKPSIDSSGCGMSWQLDGVDDSFLDEG